MIILGIDPGLAEMGYGVIEQKKDTFKALDFGCISTSSEKPLPTRLRKLRREIKKLIKKYHPDIMAVEELFFAQNAKTAMLVSQAMGAIIMACSPKMEVEMVSPAEAKKSLASNGRAKKKEVQKEVQTVLKLGHVPQPQHAADALAVALCYLLREGSEEME